MAEALERAEGELRQRRARIFMHRQLLSSLKACAVLRQQPDMGACVDGKALGDKGPWRASRDFRRVDACQREWIAYKASCCGGRAVAVPIGCNHRLCPLCNAARLERYRNPARKLLERMDHPTFLTLTIPNVSRLSKVTFEQIRGWWKAFRRANENLLLGGLYSIEATYNSKDGTWHPHLHILFDSPFAIRGMKPSDFREFQRRLVFSWLRITSSSSRTRYRRDEFSRWQKELNAAGEGSDFYKVHWRKLDIRAVQDGNGAVYEVVKYISKTNRFLDIPKAVEEFLMAVRGVRVTQTFGTLYNFKFEPNPEEIGPDGKKLPTEERVAKRLECACGKREFICLGLYGMRDVELTPAGVWLVRPGKERTTRGRHRSSSAREKKYQRKDGS